MDDSSKSRNGRGRASSLWLALAIVWVVGFCVWFYSFDLPNNNIPRRELWRALPYHMLDLVDPPVDPKSAPWSWLFLLQRLPFLAIGIAVWLGAWGLGSPVVRRISFEFTRCERLFFSLCLGLSAVSLIVLCLGLSGQLSPWPLATILMAAFCVEVRSHLKHRSNIPAASETLPNPLINDEHWSRSGMLFVTVIAVFAGFQILGAMTPQVDFDAVAYHLGGPKEWFLKGQIVRLPHNVYTSFPFLSEMLILSGMVLWGDWQWGALAGQAVIAGFAPLTALGLFAAGRRWFGETSGWLAALVYMTSPWTYRISILAGAEGTLSCYSFAALFAVLLLRSRIADTLAGNRSFGLVLLGGAMAGSSMACKYTGLISAVIPLGLISVWTAITAGREQRIKRALIIGTVFAIGVLASVGPWLLKNTIETGNPVYPLAVRVFGGIDRDEEIDAKFRRGHANRYTNWNERLSDLPAKLSDVVSRNDWHSPLMFCLAPLSFLMFRRRNASSKRLPVLAKGGTANPVSACVAADSSQQSLQRVVLCITWLYIVWQFVTWWLLTHHIDRFYVPMFSSVALVAGAGATWPTSESANIIQRRSTLWGWFSGIIIGASILFNAEVMLLVGGFNAGRMDLQAARDIATSTTPRLTWLNAEFDAGHFPPDAKILSVGEAQMFHARYPALYETVFNHSLLERICVEPGSKPPQLRPVDDIRAEFRRQGITHIDVNWAEIMRYRAPGSYGYTDFVRPETFQQLQRAGILGAPLNLPRSIVLAPLGKDAEKQLQAWGPGLITQADGQPAYVTGQIFPVVLDRDIR